jgi:peptidyl-prolyl cis-trans isomerase D
MAVIGSIRKRAGLLIGIVGFSLIAFILGDLLTNNKSFLKGGGNEVAVIGGTKVNIRDFEDRIKVLEDNYMLNSKTETLDQNTKDQLREQAWSQLVNEEVMGKQYKKLGISVSTDELFDMVQGKNIHPQIRDAFKDPKTGAFSPANVINFLKNMDNDQTGKTKAQWLNFENAIREERVGQKYNDLVKQGLYVTTAEAKMQYEASTRMASIQYIMVNYNSIPDSSVKLDNSDLEKYYNAHKTTYKQEASRKIDFVVFDVNPSDNDRRAVYESVTKEIEPFRASTSDSLFVALNSDSKPDETFHKKGTLSPNIDSIMFNSPIGTVVGPYEEGGSYKISKLTAIKFLPDSVKARHILLKIEKPEDKDMIMAKADSLKKLIKSGTKFESLVYLSSDAGSAAKGGDLGWFQQGMMVKPFNDACFEGKKGDLVVVQSEFGVHIIEILDQGKTQPVVQVLTMERRIEPSSKTYQSVFAKSNEFAGKNNTASAFEKGITDGNLNKRTADNVKETDKNLPGVDGARELVRWAYKAEKDEISKAFEMGNKFVVAHLVEIKDKGIAPLDQVKGPVEAEVRRLKKFEMISEKIKAAGSGDIQAIASKMMVQVMSADNINYASSYIPNVGSEPEVVGAVFTLKKGELSKPVKGNTGVYVLSVVDFKDPAPTKDYTANKKQLQQGMQQRAQYEVFNALKESANITDNRGRFY